MDIKQCYNYLIENIPQFQIFREQHKELTDSELLTRYNIVINKEQD